jgi:hypothetical protein
LSRQVSDRFLRFLRCGDRPASLCDESLDLCVQLIAGVLDRGQLLLNIGELSSGSGQIALDLRQRGSGLLSFCEGFLLALVFAASEGQRANQCRHKEAGLPIADCRLAIEEQSQIANRKSKIRSLSRHLRVPFL